MFSIPSLGLAQFFIEQPAGRPEMLISLITPAVLAVIIWLIGIKIEKDGGSTKVKWFALIPPVIGLIWGYRYIEFITDQFKTTVYELSGRISFLYWAVSGVQVFVIVGLIVWAMIDKRNAERF